MGKPKNSNSLILHRVTIPKKTFDLIPEQERLLFIRFGHLIFELNTLLRLFLWSSSLKNLQQEEVAARMAQGMVIARVLIGKMYEAYVLIKNRYNGDIAIEYNNLLNDASRISLLNLKHYFNKSNLINIVRKKYAFHYSHDELTKILMRIEPEDNLVFYLSKDSRNYFFSSADKIISDAMLEAIEPGNPDKAQERLEKETIAISRSLIIFLGCFLDTFLKKHLGDNLEEMGAIEIMISGHSKDSGIELPYFLSLDEG
jgi:hypothetical protein